MGKLPASIVGDLPPCEVKGGFIIVASSMMESAPKGQSWQVWVKHPERPAEVNFFDMKGRQQVCNTYNQEEAWYEYHKWIAFFNHEDFTMMDSIKTWRAAQKEAFDEAFDQPIGGTYDEGC